MFNKSVFDFSWNCITASASVKRRDQRLRCRSSVSLTHTTQKSYRRGRFASDPTSDGRNHYCHFCEPMNQWNRHNADVLWMHMSFILSLKKIIIIWVRKELWWWSGMELWLEEVALINVGRDHSANEDSSTELGKKACHQAWHWKLEFGGTEENLGFYHCSVWESFGVDWY